MIKYFLAFTFCSFFFFLSPVWGQNPSSCNQDYLPVQHEMEKTNVLSMMFKLQALKCVHQGNTGDLFTQLKQRYFLEKKEKLITPAKLIENLKADPCSKNHQEKDIEFEVVKDEFKELKKSIKYFLRICTDQLNEVKAELAQLDNKAQSELNDKIEIFILEKYVALKKADPNMTKEQALQKVKETEDYHKFIMESGSKAGVVKIKQEFSLEQKYKIDEKVETVLLHFL